MKTSFLRNYLNMHLGANINRNYHFMNAAWAKITYQKTIFRIYLFIEMSLNCTITSIGLLFTISMKLYKKFTSVIYLFSLQSRMFAHG